MGNGYKDIIKMINKTSGPKSIEEQFVGDVDRTIQVYSSGRTPSRTIKPSMLGGCKRQQVFVLLGANSDVGLLEEASFVRIGECGTDSHVRLQNACISAEGFKRPIIWIDPEEELKEAQSKGISTIVKQRQGNEVKCYNKRFNMSFMCDGIIQYHNLKMILEIKTEDHFKWIKRFSAEPKHKYQAICYSLCFGLNDIMFLYENRNYCTHKAFHIAITEEQKETVINEIETILKYAKDKIIPDKEKKCTYCKYKQACRHYGSGEHEWNPRSGQKTTYNKLF